jgi:hypothetical protein
MPDVALPAVVAAAVAGFALSGAWYAIFAAQLAAVGSAAEARPGRWWIGAELLRSLVVAAVVAGLAARAGVDGAGEGLLLGLALWVGFPLVLWTGAMLHERTPWRLAAVHGGDWLVKLLALAVIAGVWG